MDGTFNTYFRDWLNSHYAPTLIVYSSATAEKIVMKNNLSPSEFIRPFCNFAGINISFNVSERFSINVRNFRLDTYDSYQFEKVSNERLSNYLEQVVAYNQPNLTEKTLAFTKDNKERYIKSLGTSINFPWYSEYEKMFLETQNFSELEMYQQPFGSVLICSITDSIEEIKRLNKKDNVPSLLSEGVLEDTLSIMILVLYDKSTAFLSSEQQHKYIELIRNEFQRCFVFYCEVNLATEGDIKQKDIWTAHQHKTEQYNGNPTTTKLPKGLLVSLTERENLKAAFLKFINDFIIKTLQQIVAVYDAEITRNKKGIANKFKSFFGATSEKIEYITKYKVYKLNEMEKKVYLLSIIQFYFRDYEDAAENIKMLAGDVKVSFNLIRNMK